MKEKVSGGLVCFLVLLYVGDLCATVQPITPGESIWQMGKRIGETTDDIESKVCIADSQLDVIESKIDAIEISSASCDLDPVLDAVSESQELLCSKLETIDSQLDVIESKLDQSCDQSQLDVIASIIDFLSVSAICNLDPVLDAVSESQELLCSKLEIMDSQLDVIESKLDQSCDQSQLDVIESKIDAVDETLDLTFSKVCVVEDKVDSLTNIVEALSESNLDIIVSRLEDISSEIDNVDDKLLQLDSICDKLMLVMSDLDDLSASICDKLMGLDSMLDRVEDAVELVESKVCIVEEKVDNVSASIADMQIDVDLILEKSCNIDSQVDVVDSQLDVIESKIDNIQVSSSCDLDPVLDAVSQSQELLCSKLDVVESKLDQSCDQSQLDVIESKIDAVDETLDLTFSKVCVVEDKIDNVAATLSDIQADVVIIKSDVETTLTKVCDIDLQLDDIESKVDELQDDQSQLDVIESKLCEMDSQLDVIESKVDNISAACAPTAITSAPTTISDAGNYCLANNVAGDITITASDVNLDMNNRRVTGSIAINSGLERVMIENGIVEGTASTDGITVASGATDITIDNVTIKGAMRGIHFDGVSNSSVSNVSLIQNTTGLQLESSYKVNVANTVASCNVQAGFDLIGSSTNSIINSKALATGEGNTKAFDNNVFGFVSTDGFGNIFENNIANATQALTTTDSNSVVAGFALRGSEGCSKIIGNEVADSRSSTQGVTVPYGILLESMINTLTIVEQVDVNAFNIQAYGDRVWFPDGKHFVMADSSSNVMQVYQFNWENNQATKVAETSEAWSPYTVMPDGIHIIGNNFLSVDYVRLFRFDSVSNSLELVQRDFIPVSTTNSISTSHDNRYIIVGSSEGGNLILRLYRFDSISETVELLDTVTSLGFDNSVIEFSPDSNSYYVLVGAHGSESVLIYTIENDALSLIHSTPLPSSTAGMADGKWSPDGDYFAVGLRAGIVGPNFFIYHFDRATQRTQLIAQESYPFATFPTLFATISAISWSLDGQYLTLTVRETLSPRFIAVYAFDRGNNQLTLNQTYLHSELSAVSTRAYFSPDGRYLLHKESNNPSQIFSLFSGPSKNIVKDNIVYCNGNDLTITLTTGEEFSTAGGVGIAGSSIANMIIANTAYNNPPHTDNVSVPSNYQSVTNVFNSLFGQAPTDLQNISLNGCQAISSPEDVALIAKQIRYKVCNSLPSQLDVIESKIAAIEIGSASCDLDPILNAVSQSEELLCSKLETIDSQLDVIESKIESPCAATAILAATTITESGHYCVANNITDGPITIAASDVDLDLNDLKVTQGIVVNGGLTGIIIHNGTVEGGTSSDGIAVGAATTDVTIENVKIKNSVRGIYFEQVGNASIEHVSLSRNTTGLQLNNSYKVTVCDSTAVCNNQAGFELIASTTNCFINNKAFATGEKNTTAFNNNVFGFVSTNGSGNIFERNIANATQALTTTDCNSIIAGFALRGSESCTKIISNEAANAQTSSAGFTIPYGIYLEGTLDQITIVTGEFGATTCSFLRWFDWSPDAKYVAAAGDLYGNDTHKLQVFRYDRVRNKLIFVDGVIVDCDVATVDWSPDGLFVALGGDILAGGNELQIYKFDPSSCVLRYVTGTFGSTGSVNVVRWAPNAKFLAVGGNGLSPNELQIFQFDKVAQELSLVDSDFSPSSCITTIDWSPDGLYLAVGGNTMPLNPLYIYSFDSAFNRLDAVHSVLDSAASVNSIRWSSNGLYLAVGGKDLTANELQIFKFDRATEQLEYIDGALGTTGLASGVDWSPDGNYVAVGGCSLALSPLQLFSFDRCTQSLQFLDSTTTITGGEVINIAWSPDGGYIALGGNELAPDDNQFQLYKAFEFPEKNIIMDNTVYCNGNELTLTTTLGTDTVVGGVGISGSSICNFIVNNNAYNNPPSLTSADRTAWIVGLNYQFVTNVYNQLFAQYPSKLQNISIDGCEAICQPEDLALLSKQNQVKIDQNRSVLDGHSSILDVHTRLLVSIIDMLMP